MRARAVARWLVVALVAWGAVRGFAPARAAEREATPARGTELALEARSDAEVEPLLESDEEFPDESNGRDPFEGLNRHIFSFNRSVDRYLFDPITRSYQTVMPAPGRRAIYRAFKNLDSPVVLANHMLQFRPVAAATTTTRFVINSSIGLGGLFDPAASYFRVYRLEGDFGQTLARYGTPSGPFLMLPVFGPSTLRDVFGDVIDILADPFSYLIGPYQWWTFVLTGSQGLSSREAHLQDLQALEAGSVDFYSALRSAYLQNREAIVREARSEFASGGVMTASASR
jgi:phospholipid-binding lipoprotein MlaA